MDTYQTLKRICAIWSILAITVGFLIGAAGGIDLVNRRLIGIAEIIAALVVVLFAQTLSEVIFLLIDMVVYLRRISELTRPQIEPEPKLPTQAGIRKLPKG